MAEVFDETRTQYEADRAELRELLRDDEYRAANRTVINAHYTDPALATEIWQTLNTLGFYGGRVLAPGSGAGTFIGLAPATVTMTGVELDPVTAGISQALYPEADIRAESFADTRLPAGYFDAAVGNVPFARTKLHDPRHNAGNHSLHNHFIIKSLALTRPGGVVGSFPQRSHWMRRTRQHAARSSKPQTCSEWSGYPRARTAAPLAPTLSLMF